KPLTPNPIALWVMVKTVIVVGPVLERKAGSVLLPPTATGPNHKVPVEHCNGPALVDRNAHRPMGVAANGCARLIAEVSDIASARNRRTEGLRQCGWKQCIIPTVLSLPGQGRRYLWAILTPSGGCDLAHAELALQWNLSRKRIVGTCREICELSVRLENLS